MIAAGSAPSADAPPPLVGRDREWATLRAHLAATLAGRGGLVLIGGEAGIGKAALAATLAREAAAGASNRAIAADLSLSPHTVERHVANLYAKTGAHGRAAATAFARRHRRARGDTM